MQTINLKIQKFIAEEQIMNKIKLLTASAVIMSFLTACGGNDKNTVSPTPEATSENGVMNEAGNVVKDTGEDIGNVVKDAGDAVGDAAEGVTDTAGEIIDGR